MTGYLVAGHANRQSYVSLVEELNTSGRLTGIGISRAKKEHYFEIDIDGRTINEVGAYQQTSPTPPGGPWGNYFAHADGASQAHNALTIDFEFDDHLDVKIRDGQGTWPNTKYWAAYEIYNDEMDQEDPEIIQRDPSVENGLVYTVTEFPESGREQTTLEGSETISNVTLPQDTLIQNEEIEAKIELKNWEGEEITMDEMSSESELIMRRTGRSHPINSMELSSSEINTEEPVEIDLIANRGGDFEITTTFDDAANFPFEFSSLWEIY